MAAGMWDIGPRTIFAKATKLKGRRAGWVQLFALGEVLLRDAFLLPQPEREIV